MSKNTLRLDQLTSLRFFAAVMIVFHHYLGMFGSREPTINLGQGVSFFFVLSGFILTYVYPSLDTRDERRHFWRARIARIWPAYFASFLIGFWLIPYTWKTETAVPFLLMVQAWIPFSKYFYAYNAVSWSVSVEFFFYLAFPFLLVQWNRTWAPKLLLSMLLLVGMMALAHHQSLLAQGAAAGDGGRTTISAGALLYISPLARLLEFVLGMCAALAYQRTASLKWLPRRATAYELIAILLCVASLWWGNAIAESTRNELLGRSVAQWYVNSGSAVSFAVLIYAMARGGGLISGLLGNRALVFLGEISYSIYLIHQILLNYYSANIGRFAVMPNALAFGVFFVVLILVSYLMWACVEVPGRRLIAGRPKVAAPVDPAGGWWARWATVRKPLAAGVALVAILAVVVSGGDRQGLIRQQDALQLTPDAMKKLVGIEFGGLFALRGLDVKCEPDGLHVRLAWERMVDRKLDYTTAVHVTDAKGAILAQLDFKSPVQQRDLRAGDVWVDTMVIAPGKMPPGTAGVAVGLYDASVQLLAIDRGPTDWGGRRLVIGVDRCPAP